MYKLNFQVLSLNLNQNNKVKYITLFYLVISTLLFTTCRSKRNIDNNMHHNKLTLTNITDTLQFTSGIRSILQDSKANYWFGSDKEGVCKYDGQNFTYYNSDNGLCGNQVIYIKEDNAGLIWFGTSSGLCYFNDNKFNSYIKLSPRILLDDKNYTAWSMNATDLWFPGNTFNELIRIDNGRSYTVQYPIVIPSRGNSVDYGINGFSKSKNGGLWIAHYSGVSYYDGKSIQFISDSTMQFDGRSMYMHVRSILEDSKGRLWIGNNGIGVLLKVKDSIIHFSEKYNLFKNEFYRVNSTPGTLMHVFAIKEDSEGNIWFGDRDSGAWRFDGTEIKNFMLDSTLKTQHIWDIFEDKNAHLLFASADRGVYKFNGKGFDRVF